MLGRYASTFPYLLLIGGAGLLAYFVPQWNELPEWSEAEIEQSVELNLAIDLQKLGPHLQPEGEKLELLRRMVRAEVEAEIQRDREKVEGWIGLGLICLVFGTSGVLLQRGLSRPGPQKQ